MPNAQDFAFALGAQFPNLTPSDLNLHQEPDADLARVEWQDWTALFPQSETAAQRLRIMAALMPHLRGFISPTIPIWEHSRDTDDWQRNWYAAPRLEGRPLRPELFNDQNRERLVRDLAAFCHELHGFSVERARGLGAASARAWRDEHESLSRRSLQVLRPLAGWSQYAWARRWWRRLLEDDALWRHPPALVHGGISEQRLLVDTFVQQLVGVDGWFRIRVADPALDFAHLVDVYGTELTWRIVERYGELGSTADAALFRRIRLQQTVRRFRAVVEAADREGPESEAASTALNRLR